MLVSLLTPINLGVESASGEHWHSVLPDARRMGCGQWRSGAVSQKGGEHEAGADSRRGERGELRRAIFTRARFPCVSSLVNHGPQLGGQSSTGPLPLFLSSSSLLLGNLPTHSSPTNYHNGIPPVHYPCQPRRARVAPRPRVLHRGVSFQTVFLPPSQPLFVMIPTLWSVFPRKGT
jgi:hypothetical protein